MGEAFDRSGNVLGSEYGATKSEVLDRLEKRFPDAEEVRIRTVRDEATGSDAAQQESMARPPLSQRITLENVDHVFTYQPWNQDQTERGREVTAALIAAAKTILRNVPECPTRTRALNDLIDARMKANAAITHNGRF